jgi:beta-galactosidase
VHVVHVVHNWGWEPATAVAPIALDDLLRGDSLAAGDSVALGAWDVRVLRSAALHSDKENSK